MPRLGSSPSLLYYSGEPRPLGKVAALKLHSLSFEAALIGSRRAATIFWFVMRNTFLRFRLDQECLLSLGLHIETPEKPTHTLKWQQRAISVKWSSPVYSKQWVWGHLERSLSGKRAVALVWKGKNKHPCQRAGELSCPYFLLIYDRDSFFFNTLCIPPVISNLRFLCMIQFYWSMRSVLICLLWISQYSSYKYSLVSAGAELNYTLRTK